MIQHLWLLAQRFLWAFSCALRSEFRRVEAPLPDERRHEPTLAEIRAARRAWLNNEPEYVGMTMGRGGVYRPIFECNMMPVAREGRLAKNWED